MPRLYRKAYLDLTSINQRSFITHILWLAVELCLLCAA